MFRQRALCHLVGSTWPSMAGRCKIQRRMIKSVITIISFIVIIIIIIDYVAEYVTITNTFAASFKTPHLMTSTTAFSQ